MSVQLQVQTGHDSATCRPANASHLYATTEAILTRSCQKRSAKTS